MDKKRGLRGRELERLRKKEADPGAERGGARGGTGAVSLAGQI